MLSVHSLALLRERLIVGACRLLVVNFDGVGIGVNVVMVSAGRAQAFGLLWVCVDGVKGRLAARFGRNFHGVDVAAHDRSIARKSLVQVDLCD